MESTTNPQSSSSQQTQQTQQTQSEQSTINLLPTPSKEQIKEIHIYDFDGTLFQTPTPDTGIPYFEKVMGYEWPYRGWWSVPQSLQKPFRIKRGPACRDFFKSKKSKHVFVVMMTGRNDFLMKEVLRIMKRYRVIPHRCYFKPSGMYDTLIYKLETIHQLVKEFPNLKSLTIWEDRKMHAEEFLKLNQVFSNIEVKVNFIQDANDNDDSYLLRKAKSKKILKSETILSSTRGRSLKSKTLRSEKWQKTSYRKTLFEIQEFLS